MLKEKRMFQGGVHPGDGSDKALSRGKPIVPYIPSKVRISMKQGLGPACNCTVQVGDVVKQGQKIGEANHFLSADVHSSVSGEVVSIENGIVEIKVSKCTLDYTKKDYYHEFVETDGLERKKLVSALKKYGIVGMGGAGFPAGAKYETSEVITHVLINAAECELFLTCDEHLIKEQAMAILNGARALKIAAAADKVVICIEDNKKDCYDYLSSLLVGHESEVDLMLLPTRYPQGGEKQLIKAVMKVEIPSGKLPANVGAIVSNIHSTKAAADAIFGKIASTSRVITVTGDVNNPTNYLVPIGTNVGELLEESGDVLSENNRIILGGVMTGRVLGTNLNATALKEMDVCVTKTSGGLITLDGYFEEESSCIKCGGCANACPIGLSPFKIDSAIRNGKIDLCKSLSAVECIACGCCSYVCPAKRELTFHTVQARDAVRAKLREEAQKNAK
ncbi:MAG: RnfABCDGE type electron transport complex subunit C [Erysipelotrichaceae bacterium]|nr:RnfABCDGE type electron transport complex subunit C [Erysipelotrichaceae bacterium]